MRPQEPFERYPALKSWIERLANTPRLPISLGDWCVFIGALNQAILAAEARTPDSSDPAIAGEAAPTLNRGDSSRADHDPKAGPSGGRETGSARDHDHTSTAAALHGAAPKLGGET